MNHFLKPNLLILFLALAIIFPKEGEATSGKAITISDLVIDNCLTISQNHKSKCAKIVRKEKDLLPSIGLVVEPNDHIHTYTSSQVGLNCFGQHLVEIRPNTHIRVSKNLNMIQLYKSNSKKLDEGSILFISLGTRFIAQS